MSWPSIKKLVSDVKSGLSSAEENVTKSLKRARETTEYNVLLEVSTAALKRAKQLDENVKGGDATGALLGVPVVVKDNFLTHGTRTTAASKILGNFKSPYQATVVEKLEAEGAVIIGKANLDEFAHGSSTENSAFGPTRNPHDKDRVPGGSSGGSAAAVALDIAPLALGTDTGGSVRLPASFCGNVGLKPTYGLISRYGIVAMASSTDVVGPIANTVEEVAYVLDVLAGIDPLDSTTIDREDSYKLDKPSTLKGLKVGVISEHMADGVDAKVLKVTEESIEKLEKAGAKVSRISMPISELALAVYYVVVPAEISSNLARYDGVKYGLSAEKAANLEETYLQTRKEGFGEEPLRRILTGTFVLSSGYQDAYYKQAQKVRTQISEEYDKAFRKVDVLLGPTAASLPFKLGEKRDPLSMYMSDSMTIASNLAGVCAISLPAGSSDGLPVGIHLQAPKSQDKRLLQVAAAFEEVL